MGDNEDDWYGHSFVGSKVIPTLQGQYKNINIRAIIVKGKDNPQWYCALLKVYFTKDEKTTIEEIHQKKHRLTSIKDDNLKFVAECTDISEAERVLRELNKMKITINTRTTALHSGSSPIESETALSEGDAVLEQYMSKSNLEEYPHRFIVINSKETPREFLASLGFSSKVYVYRLLHEEINTFLDTTNPNSSNRNGIIIFPIYWKKLNLDSVEQLTYLAKFQLHSSLLTHSQLSISSIENGIITDRFETSNLRQDQNDDMKLFYISRDEVKIQPETILLVEMNLPTLEMSLSLRYEFFEEYLKSNVKLTGAEKDANGLYERTGIVTYDPKKIFVVHGHDELSKHQLESILRELGLEPIILNDKANEGKTIFEKLEKHTKNVGYAIVLLTPDDVGGQNEHSLKSRARQNVILELGFFMGKLGRERVCCLYKRRDEKGGLETPTNIGGIAYIPYHDKVDDCHRDFVRELKTAGYIS